MIQGVKIYDLKQIDSESGSVYHALKSTDAGFAGFGEAYFSTIKEGAIKGWKRHNKIPLNIVVVSGKIKFVLFDDRKNSPTCGEFADIILSPETNYKRLFLPPGIWMAFVGMGSSTSMLMDIIPEPHNPLEADRKKTEEIKYNFNL